MTLTLTGTNSTVTLTDPKTVSTTTVKNMSILTLYDGDEKAVDRARTSDGITLTGTQTTSAYTKCKTLNQIMDGENEVTISGLADSNLNADYRIGNFSFSADIGYPTNMYDWTITLERMRD